MWYHFMSLQAFVLLLPLTSSQLLKREPTCTDIVIPINIAAQNAEISELLDGTVPLTTLLASLNSVFSFTVPIRDTYNISARYCEPEEIVEGRQNVLQILVHGLTYDKNYWSGLGAPGASFSGTDDFSWVSYASAAGYPTLAIDRLGSGNSSHPDPILVVQTPAQVEVLHQIIVKARAGTIPSARTFDTIIIAGHSYGSIIGNALNQKYPEDADAIILTGFSNNFKTAMGGIFLDADFVPASSAIPAYSDLPAGYITSNSAAGVLKVFYYPGGYDPALAAYDYSGRGTIAVGELVSLLFAGVVAPSYTRPVYLVTGAHDFIFCNPLGLPNLADCSPTGPGYLPKTHALYPAADVFEYYAPPNSGHCWHLHFDALTTFYNIHSWLDKQGF